MTQKIIHLKRLKICLLFLLLISLNTYSNATSQLVINERATISLSEIFSPKADSTGGIIGTITGQNNAYIQVEVYSYEPSQPNKKGILLYLLKSSSTTTEFSGSPFTYAKASIPSSIPSLRTYYPSSWVSNDIKPAIYALERHRVDNATTIKKFLSRSINVIVNVFVSNATFQEAKIPGIGIIGSNGKNTLFHSGHYCSNLLNSASKSCQKWRQIKSPEYNESDPDLLFSSHRGYWGYDRGNGPPENTIEAFDAALPYTSIIEADIMITSDSQLVASHDYNLTRLTNFQGSDSVYIFDKSITELGQLKLRKRNGTISNTNMTTLFYFLDEITETGTILNIDIKSATPRYNTHTDACIAHCEYDIKQHGTIAQNLQKENFVFILTECIKRANQLNALNSIAFKTPYSHADILAHLPDEFSDSLLNKVLFIPVVYQNKSAIEKAQFIDDWNNAAGASVASYEVNFMNRGESYLKPFTKNNITYDNILHYIYATTKRRPGFFAEVPAGPKGIVDRWAKWRIRTSKKFLRGDPYYLMSIPYFNISLITTDRVDIWNQVQSIYH